jgi:hypothetical protein
MFQRLSGIGKELETPSRKGRYFAAAAVLLVAVGGSAAWYSLPRRLEPFLPKLVVFSLAELPAVVPIQSLRVLR